MQETQETRVQSLDREDPLQQEIAAVFLPGKSHGQRSLVGYSPQGRKEWVNTSAQGKGWLLPVIFEQRPILRIRGLLQQWWLSLFIWVMKYLTKWDPGGIRLPEADREQREAGVWCGFKPQLNGHEFEQASGVSDGQESLTCYSPWGLKKSDTTERLNWTDAKKSSLRCIWCSVHTLKEDYHLSWPFPTSIHYLSPSTILFPWENYFLGVRTVFFWGYKPIVSSCVCVYLLSHVWLFVIPWTIASQAPMSMEFSRQ